MACFIVSAVEAIAVTAIEKQVEKKEMHEEASHEVIAKDAQKVSMSTKLKWLKYLLWGGSILLAFEHIWHGEVVPWYPFLTAMSNAADAAEMFHEMATVGVCMAALITLVWAGICVAADYIIKRPQKAE